MNSKLSNGAVLSLSEIVVPAATEDEGMNHAHDIHT